MEERRQVVAVVKKHNYALLQQRLIANWLGKDFRIATWLLEIY